MGGQRNEEEIRHAERAIAGCKAALTCARADFVLQVM